MTNHELELQYTPSKCILIEGTESCRIPVPVERCPLAKLSKIYEGETISLQDLLELGRICSDHIASLVDLKWTLIGNGASGKASLKGISLTNDMLEIVKMSPLQWGMFFMDYQYK